MTKKDDDYSRHAPRHQPGPKPVMIIGAICPLHKQPLTFGMCSGCKFFVDVWYPSTAGDAVLCNHAGQPAALTTFLAEMTMPKQGNLL